MLSIYNRLPIAAQNLACSLYGFKERRVRFGKPFWNYYNWLKETESASKMEIKAYQDEQIYKLIKYVYKEVPYYRRIMQERALRPEDITSRGDLQKLPVLTKQDVIHHTSDLIASCYDRKKLRIKKTSGHKIN